jgi:hypothetical protein
MPAFTNTFKAYIYQRFPNCAPPPRGALFVLWGGAIVVSVRDIFILNDRDQGITMDWACSSDGVGGQ